MSDPVVPPLNPVYRVVLRRGFGRAWLATSIVMAGACLGLQALVAVLTGHGLALPQALQGMAVGLFTAPLLAWLLHRVAQLEQARLKSEAQARAESADGVPARSHFQRAAEREFARCRRYGEDAAVLLIAADHYRAIAAQHGTAAAESVLTAVALKARAGLRQPDLVARYGFEELVVFLPHTDPLGALDVAERIREAAAGTRLRRQGQEMGTTVSIGVASMGAGHDALDVLTHDADIALLEAKQAGRNCVRAAPIQPRASEHQQLEQPR